MSARLYVHNETVRVVHPVNGLRYGALHRVKYLTRDRLGPVLLVYGEEGQLAPPGGELGYFPWRFEPADAR